MCEFDKFWVRGKTGWMVSLSSLYQGCDEHNVNVSSFNVADWNLTQWLSRAGDKSWHLHGSTKYISFYWDPITNCFFLEVEMFLC